MPSERVGPIPSHAPSASVLRSVFLICNRGELNLRDDSDFFRLMIYILYMIFIFGVGFCEDVCFC